MLIPLVVASTFGAQTHIPYLVMAGGLGAAAAAVVVVRWARSDERGPMPRPLLITGASFVVLWLAPAVDQLRREPGNITLRRSSLRLRLRQRQVNSLMR